MDGGTSTGGNNRSLAKLSTVNCPEGTVPIRRIKKEDLIRPKSLSGSDFPSAHPMSAEIPGQHVRSTLHCNGRAHSTGAPKTQKHSQIIRPGAN